jgi:hypothetical protein
MLWLWAALTLPARDDTRTLFRTGQIRVLQNPIGHFAGVKQPEGALPGGPYNYLMRGDTHRGLWFLRPKPQDRGNPEKDLSRLATTYHHRGSPLGRVMELFNWFHPSDNQEGDNRFFADARLPVSIVAYGGDPLCQLVNTWSEPPYAVVGMYVGGMASYARPFQYVDFFENDPAIIKLSQPDGGQEPFFGYVQDAKERGALVRVFQRNERLTLARRGAKRFYHALVVEICPHDRLEDISVPLLTREGMALCMDTLAGDGILCIHVSNRYVNVVPVVADVADSLGLVCLRGMDVRYNTAPGYFTSEWVMVARKRQTLDRLTVPRDYDPGLAGKYWEIPAVTATHVWTDSGRNSLRGLFRASPGLWAVRRAVQDSIDPGTNLLSRCGYYRLARECDRGVGDAIWGLNRLITDLQNRRDLPAAYLSK